MASVKVSTVGQPRKDVDFSEGETLGSLFNRIGIDIPAGSGVEVWINGEKADSWTRHTLQSDDAIVLMPNVKGARARRFVARLVR